MRKGKSSGVAAIIIVVLAILLFIIRQYRNTPDTTQYNTAVNKNSSVRGLNRTPQQIKYSQHARCRMSCRHITEREVEMALKNGTINYRKSELNADDCHKKYAVEDYAGNQHVRIIFAPCGNVVTVVTCIDLEKEWKCHCPGDNE